MIPQYAAQRCHDPDCKVLIISKSSSRSQDLASFRHWILEHKGWTIQAEVNIL